MAIRLVMLGDVVGLPGCQAVVQLAPMIRQRWRIDALIINAENAAKGAGLTPDLYHMLCDAKVDGITLGDHTYDKLQILRTLETQTNIIRPANLARSAKGRRWMAIPVLAGQRKIYVVTLLGRLFLQNMPADDPFATVDRVLTELPEPNPIVVVEIHAQATSEKQALAWYCNGRVALVAGTHTHVPTADARILPPHSTHSSSSGKPHTLEKLPGPEGLPGAGAIPRAIPGAIPGAEAGPGAGAGTAYITDLGMCGSWDSILGRKIDPVLTKMTTSMPAPFDVAAEDPRVSGVFVEIDEPTGLATHVERIELKADPTKPPFPPGT